MKKNTQAQNKTLKTSNNNNPHSSAVRRRLWEAVQQANPVTQKQKSAQGDLYWLHNRPRGAHQEGEVDRVRWGSYAPFVFLFWSRIFTT